MDGRTRYRLLVIGVGNDLRGDDGAGLAAVRALGALPVDVMTVEHQGDACGLVDLWSGADTAIVVDAVKGGGGPAGEIYRKDLSAGDQFPVPAALSSHGLGLFDAFGLGRALGRLPKTLILYGIEVEDVNHGEALTPPVRGAVERVATLIREEILPLLEVR